MLTAVSIPLSPFLLSVSMFLFAEGQFRKKIRLFIRNDSLWVFLLIYAAHLLWLINTSDFEWGLHDLRVKLPLLVFPVLIATSPALTINHVKYIMMAFILSVTVNSVISTAVLLLFDKAFYNIREISLFISHIRFSLMIVISISSLIYFIFSRNIIKSKTEKRIYIAVLIWLISFLFILRSFTGVFILLLLLFPILYYIKTQVKLRYLSRTVNIFTFVFVTYVIINLAYPGYLYFRKTAPDKEGLKKTTVNGNPYTHYLNSKDRENGYLIWYYLCIPELEKEWNKVSNIAFDEKDKGGYTIKSTLIRYLTSRGYTKDSLGVSKLTDKDIELIENGVANYIYGRKFGIYPRIYELIWELDKYFNGVNPSGHSFTQRFEYIKTGSSIIRDHFWFGVGTGDVPKAFHLQYVESDTPLNSKAQLRTHNQYITFFISFGLIGFLVTVFAFFYPVFKCRKKLFFVSYLSLIVLFLSMINEDTLETHIGVSLFSFLYALFIFGHDGSEKSEEITDAIKSEIAALKE